MSTKIKYKKFCRWKKTQKALDYIRITLNDLWDSKMIVVRNFYMHKFNLINL